MRSRNRRRAAAGALYLAVALGVGSGVFEACRRLLPVRRTPPAPVSAPPPDTSGLASAQRDLLPLGPDPRFLGEAGPRLASELGPIRPVGAGIPVPEPSPGILWIVGIAALYTLYVPPRSW